MKRIFATLSLVFMLGGFVSAGEENQNGQPAIARSIVTIEVARKQYDYYQPWNKPMRQFRKSGVAIGSRKILTTADDLSDRTLVRVQKNGRGSWSIGEVTWIDYYANLALVTVAEQGFWSGLKPLTFERSATSSRGFQVLRWTEGNLETRAAELSRFAVPEDSTRGSPHVMIEAASEIQNAGHGEPVTANSRLAGLVQSQEGRLLTIITASFIQPILEAQAQNQYPGLGYFHFFWQRAENPASLALLKLQGAPRGVVVIDIPERSDGSLQVLKPRDIILQIDKFEIDTHGDYLDPEFGHLMLENLAARKRWAGSEVPMKIWREGQLIEVSYRLPKFVSTTRLVPYAIYDQQPEYLIVGGLVFQVLTDSFLQSWGPEWKKQAPFRLYYYNDQPRTKERPTVLFLSQVLPDPYNIGYQGEMGLVIDKVNGEHVNQLAELRDALSKPVGGFHIIDFVPGDSLQRLVLEAGEAESQATARVLERYGIAASFHFETNSTPGTNLITRDQYRTRQSPGLADRSDSELPR